MSGFFKKAAITLAAALTTAAASAQGFSIWIGSGHHDGRHPHSYPHGNPRYDHYPQRPPRYEAAQTAKEKCNRAIFNQARLDIYLPRTQVGFIEGRSYACRINLKTGRLTQAYNLNTPSGYNSFERAKDSAYDREYRHDFRPGRHW